jgi:hypothetical protein
MNKLYCLKLILLILIPINFWRATIELPDAMSNQTCCIKNVCGNEEPIERKDPYRLFIIGRWVYTCIWAGYGFYPTEPTFNQIAFYIVFTVFYLLWSIVVYSSLTVSKCINPTRKPIFLVGEYFPYQFILIMLPFIGLVFLVFYLVESLYEKRQSSETIEPSQELHLALEEPPEMEETIIVA